MLDWSTALAVASALGLDKLVAALVGRRKARAEQILAIARRAAKGAAAIARMSGKADAAGLIHDWSRRFDDLCTLAGIDLDAIDDKLRERAWAVASEELGELALAFAFDELGKAAAAAEDRLDLVLRKIKPREDSRGR